MTTSTHRQAATGRPAKGLIRLFCLLALAAPPVFAASSPPSAFSPDSIVVQSASQALANAAIVPDHNSLAIAKAEPTASASIPRSGRLQTLLGRALALLGTPYRWGGTSPDGFDCSGLVGYVFRSALGIELPRVSRDMANQGQLITDRTALVAGDLVFFSRRGKRVDHVGIYMGDGRFLHAPRTGKDVEVSNLDSGYWSGKFMQARRVAEI